MNPSNYQAALDAAIEESCRQWHVTREQIMGRFRNHGEASARHCVAFAIRALGASYATIGALLGGRDHGTILHSVLQAQNQMDVDHTFRAKAYAVREAATGAHKAGPLSLPSEQRKTQPCPPQGAGNGI